MKIFEIHDMFDVFNSHSDCHNTKLNYKIMNLLMAVDKDEKFYRKTMSSIYDDCLEKDADGNFIQTEQRFKIKSDKIEEYKTRINELTEVEVDAPDIKFTIDELDCLGLTVNELFIIKPLLDESV